MRHVIRFSIALLTLTLAACGGEDNAPGSTGTLWLSMTDAPVDDATSVVVQFNAVAFKREGADAEVVRTLTPKRQLDLLQYQGGKAALLLDGIELPAGRYEWIRLMVDNEPFVRDSWLANGFGECELRIPSGAESGLKLNRGFTVPADGYLALTIDFDLRKSIHAPPGQQSQLSACTQGYLMRPTLRIVDDANVGAITGEVDTMLVGAQCKPKIYIFEGNSIVPDDLEDGGGAGDVDPYVVVSVPLTNGTGVFSYRAAFIPPGAYTVAFTCGDDDATLNQTLTFLTPKTVTVQANLISTASFAPVP